MLNFTTTVKFNTLIPPMLGMIGKNPKFRKRSTSTPWPSGADGALVLNGTVLNLAPGTVKDYSSVSISNGGGILMTAGSGWIKIGCSGNFSIDVTSTITGSLGTVAGTFTDTAPDGMALSYGISYTTGGDGGNGGTNYGLGSTEAFGNGGGGGGGPNAASPDGRAPTNTVSGGGGDGWTGLGFASDNPGPGGTSVYGGDGDPGLDSNVATTTDPAAGTGAAGGFRGHAGQGIYIKVAGNVTNGAGSIIASGGNGGNGGDGGDAFNNNVGQEADGGGGGGGGSGGSAGKIIIRIHGTGTFTNTQVFGGGGGGGGNGGNGFANGGDESPGQNGTGGDSGNAGTVDQASY